jgi:hypothetical protein
METILREAVGWLSVLVSAAGAVVCIARLGRVRFAGVLAAGFGLQALVSTFYRLFTLLALRGGAAASLGAGLAAVSLVGVLANALIVVGVAGLLTDLGRGGGNVTGREGPPAPAR